MSEENRSHRIKITNIPEGNLLFQKDDRTWEPIIISGTIFLFFGLSSVKILALPFGLATIWQLIKKPDKLFSGYDRFIVIYDRKDREHCDLIYHSEIKTWNSRINQGTPYFVLNLKQGNSIRIVDGCCKGMYSYFLKCMPEKEFRNLNKERKGERK